MKRDEWNEKKRIAGQEAFALLSSAKQVAKIGHCDVTIAAVQVDGMSVRPPLPARMLTAAKMLRKIRALLNGTVPAQPKHRDAAAIVIRN